MKTQMKCSRLVSIALAFLALVSLTFSCKENKQPASAVSSAKPAPPAMDIHTAVMRDDLQAIQQHIAAGSDLNARDPLGGSSPLISATLFGKTAIAKALIDAGADLDFQNNEGSTALHTAAFFCRPEILQWLLDKGANKTIINKYGATAYQSVAAPFAEAKPAYESLGKMLEPMGLKLDLAYLEKTRPQMAAMLK